MNISMHVTFFDDIGRNENGGVLKKKCSVDKVKSLREEQGEGQVWFPYPCSLVVTSPWAQAGISSLQYCSVIIPGSHVEILH